MLHVRGRSYPLCGLPRRQSRLHGDDCPCAERSNSVPSSLYSCRPVWQALLRSPAHYVLEALLLAVIAYIVLFKRAYDPSQKCVCAQYSLQQPWRSTRSRDPHFGDQKLRNMLVDQPSFFFLHISNFAGGMASADSRALPRPRRRSLLPSGSPSRLVGDWHLCPLAADSPILHPLS